MPFWSAATLRARLDTDGLVTDYCEKRVGRANYTLRVGSEAYLSVGKSGLDRTEHRRPINLSETGNCTIHPGQFAFLLTDETVRVPHDAIAFISVRAEYKFMGLVNVSGFHVDPGWHDRLIFAVFNGGPSNITVSRFDPLFHIWFADLDDDAEQTSDKKLKGGGIGSHVINGLGDQVVSLVGLDQRLGEVATAVDSKLEGMKAEQAKIVSLQQLLVGLGIAFTAAVATIAVNLFMNSEDGPSVLLDQRSDILVPGEPPVTYEGSAPVDGAEGVSDAPG